VGQRPMPKLWVWLACAGLAFSTSTSALAQAGPLEAPEAGGAPEPPQANGAPPPQGKGWVFLPSIGISEIATDNVLQATSPRKADLITIINPGLQITGDTARFKGNLNLQPQFQRYLKTQDQNYLAFNLNGAGEATLSQDLLYFDAAASSSQSNINGNLGYTNPNLIPGSQHTQVFTTNLGPVLRTDVGSLFHTELLYQFSATHFNNNTTVPGSTGLSNTTQNEGRLTLNTLDNFGKLNSTLIADAYKSSGGGINSSSTDKRIELDNEYAVTDTLFLLGQFGYEDQTFPGSTASDITGAIAQGGLRYTPNPDTSVSLLYGLRQGTTEFEGNLRFAVTQATNVFISYSESVETTQQLIQQNLGTGGTTTTPGQPPIPIVNPNFPLQNNVFRFKTLNGGITSAVGRNTFTLTLYRDEQTSLAGVNSSNGTSMGGSFGWTREMSERMTGSLFAGYSSNVGGGGGTGNITASINYVFSDTLHGTIRYDFIDGNNGTVFTTTNVPNTGRYTQNALTLSLVKTF